MSVLVAFGLISFNIWIIFSAYVIWIIFSFKFNGSISRPSYLGSIFLSRLLISLDVSQRKELLFSVAGKELSYFCKRMKSWCIKYLTANSSTKDVLLGRMEHDYLTLWFLTLTSSINDSKVSGHFYDTWQKFVS